MEVNPSVPAKTIREFIAYAKANPGKINMASGGVGSPLHVAGELFKMMAGVDLVHVPYRSEALALPDLLAGQVQVLFGVMPASLGYVRAGKLRPASPQRSVRRFCPMSQPSPSFYRATRRTAGMASSAQRHSQRAYWELNKTVNAALADPTMKRRFVDLGCAVFAGTPADFEKFIVDETDKWANVVKFADIKPQ